MNKLQALKLVEVTSQRQADNGTVCYFDPITGCDYIMYESGYVRRKYSIGRSWATGKKMDVIYQLNKKVEVPITYTDWYGNLRTSTKIERVLLNTPEERMECAARAVVSYRNYLKKN